MQEWERIARTIFPLGRLKHIWPLQGGISAGMTGLEIEVVDGRSHKLIVRTHQHPSVAENEFRLLQQISSLDLATPVPYHLDLSGQILAAPYLVIGYSDGEMVFAPANLDNHVRQLAAQLARIHRVNSEIVDLSFLPQPGRECGELARPLTRSDSAFDEKRIRAALTAIGPLPPQNAAALLHGDFWPGNSLWRNGRLVAVIDWEDAQLGDPLIDLAQSRSEIVWIFGVEAMQTFTRHYQSLRALDYRHLPYWDLCAALRIIRLIGGDLTGFAAYFGEYGRADITNQTIQQDMSCFITQAIARLTAYKK